MDDDGKEKNRQLNERIKEAKAKSEEPLKEAQNNPITPFPEYGSFSEERQLQPRRQLLLTVRVLFLLAYLTAGTGVSLWLAYTVCIWPFKGNLLTSRCSSNPCIAS